MGKIVRSEQVGTHQQLIGKAQAWYYQPDRTLILWEAFLERAYCRRDNPDDPNLHELWRGFERFLLQRFPQTQRIATPSWEPLYDTDPGRRFWPARLYPVERARLRQGGDPLMANTTYQVTLSTNGTHSITITSDDEATKPPCPGHRSCSRSWPGDVNVPPSLTSLPTKISTPNPRRSARSIRCQWSACTAGAATSGAAMNGCRTAASALFALPKE